MEGHEYCHEPAKITGTQSVLEQVLELVALRNSKIGKFALFEKVEKIKSFHTLGNIQRLCEEENIKDCYGNQMGWRMCSQLALKTYILAYCSPKQFEILLFAIAYYDFQRQNIEQIIRHLYLIRRRLHQWLKFQGNLPLTALNQLVLAR